MRKPVVACIHYWTMVHDAFQCARSFKYFHPDIPIVIYDKDFSDKIGKEFGMTLTYAPIMKTLTDEYEMVIHLDADCIVTSRLEEILKGDFDVASTKCNNYLGMAGAVNPGYWYKDISIDKYINVGTVVINGEKGRQFLDEWIELNKQPNDGSIPFGENGTFNIIFYNGKYNGFLLDEEDNPWYYGVSSAWGEGSNHWVSWKSIKLENDQLYLRHKHIRLLHKAGAGSPDHRFDFDQLFNPDVANWMKKITKEN